MVTAIKPSILLMYRRIFSIDDSFRRQSFLLGAVVVAFWTASTIVSIMACIPVQYSWTSMGDPRYCYNYNIFWMVSGAVEVLIDTAILALPVRMVLRLQLSLKRKISIMLIFLLGGLYVDLALSTLPLRTSPLIFAVSLLPALFVLSTDTHQGDSLLRTQKPSSGQKCTSVSPLSAPVYLAYAPSFCASHLALQGSRRSSQPSPNRFLPRRRDAVIMNYGGDT